MENTIPETMQDKEHIGQLLIESYNYWHKKRLLFNVLMVIPGLLSFFLFPTHINIAYLLFCIVIWGLIANTFYSTGYVWESYLIAKKKNTEGLGVSFRNQLFWGGTALYIIAGTVTCMYISIITD